MDNRRRMQRIVYGGLAIVLGWATGRAASGVLDVSVYATAGDVQAYLADTEKRAEVLPLLKRIGVSRIFLEGRRGDEHVPPEMLAKVRAFFESHGIRAAGGIATVPGSSFGVRQEGGLDWLNWEADKTRKDVAGFFADQAKVFDEIIVDDFYCTGDTSAQAEQGRAGRSWSTYRRDLLVSLIDPLMRRPAEGAHSGVRLIIKFPQWYDRFHVFGYDPPRMAEKFDGVWVGTEVRNPRTRRMGYVQPTQGYMNYLWLKSVAGRKVCGAWFDHIECDAFQFVDQAYLSVLAGAPELTLFHLGDLISGHSGSALFAERLSDLCELADAVRGKEPRGILFYKPAGSDADDNLFLMDYVGMLGLPVVPSAAYPASARVVFLAAHAAADSQIETQARRHLGKGATLILTPAFLRRTGSWAAAIAGAVSLGPTALGRVNDSPASEPATLEIDAGLRSTGAEVLIEVDHNGQRVPLLMRRRIGGGTVFVLNIRTFNDADYRGSGEWLLPPVRLGWSHPPQALVDALRAHLTAPLNVDLQAPAGVLLSLRGKEQFLYNSNDRSVRIRLAGKGRMMPPHSRTWLTR